MKLGEIKLGITDYIDAEIAQKAQGAMKWIIYSAGGIFALKGEKILGPYLPFLTSMGLMNPDGDIDIEALHSVAKEGIKKSGSFTWAGIIFDDKDIEKLYQNIKKKEVKTNASL